MVFTRDRDGSVRHFYPAHLRMADDIDQRGIDLLSPVWNILDLTPRGVRRFVSGTVLFPEKRGGAGVAPPPPSAASGGGLRAGRVANMLLVLRLLADRDRSLHPIVGCCTGSGRFRPCPR